MIGEPYKEVPGVATDEEEINALILLYISAADEVDLDAFADCFTPDGIFEFVNEGLTAKGRNELRALLSNSSRAGIHVCTDIRVEIHGDKANCSSRLSEYCRDTGVLNRSGTYSDELSRNDGKWRFSSRRLTYSLGKLER
jgi:uncharacterized protein (TIGR02246 family)